MSAITIIAAAFIGACFMAATGLVLGAVVYLIFRGGRDDADEDADDMDDAGVWQQSGATVRRSPSDHSRLQGADLRVIVRNEGLRPH